MERKVLIWLFVAFVILLPVAAFGVVHWYENRYEKLKVYGTENHTIADFTLINQQGHVTSLKSWEGKIIVANFFFSHCPSVCPKMMAQLKTVQQFYYNDRLVQINSFTVDPEHDSANKLANYAVQMGINNKRWNLLTGDKRQIYRLARNSFMVDATDGDGGPDDFIHSDKLVLVDTKKRIRGFYDGTNKTEVSQLVQDIQKLKKETD